MAKTHGSRKADSSILGAALLLSCTRFGGASFMCALAVQSLQGAAVETA